MVMATELADGARNETWKPNTTRVATSIASVIQGRPTGFSLQLVDDDNVHQCVIDLNQIERNGDFWSSLKETETLAGHARALSSGHGFLWVEPRYSTLHRLVRRYRHFRVETFQSNRPMHSSD
jgi:hypothetical protein